MGVMIGMAAAGLAGGILGGMGQQQEQMAQYHMQRMEAEKQNYLNQRNTDEANWIAARKAAITKFNNKQIAETAVKGYADMRRQNRQNFESTRHQAARSFVAQRNAMITEATGKNLRGGMVDRMMAVQGKQAERQRLNNRMAYMSAEEQAKNQYNSMLNKRDMLTRQNTTMFVPSPMPVKPATGMTLGMLGGMLGGGMSGASMGANMKGAF